MDAHFENILTDGEQLYYSDFGLALSDKFTLSNIENHFTKDNADYDYASGSSNLMHTVLTSYLEKTIGVLIWRNSLTMSLAHKYQPE